MSSELEFPHDIERERWVLAFLYAPMEGQKATPLSYPTEFSLGMFFLERNLIEKFNKEQLYAFIPSKYLPRSEVLGDILLELEQRDYIERLPAEEGRFAVKLTKDGVWEAKEAYDSLSTQERDMVEWVKAKRVAEDNGHTYSYMYQNYPEFVNPTVQDKKSIDDSEETEEAEETEVTDSVTVNN